MGIAVIFMALLFLVLIYSAIKEEHIKNKEYKKYNSKKSAPPSDISAEINRLEQENQSLRNEKRQLLDEVLKLNRDNEALRKLFQKYSKRCEELLYWSHDSTSAFLPSYLHDLYRDSIYSPRLDRALSSKFSFIYPLSVSGTVSSSGKMYHTTLMDCTCEDHQQRHVVCKHMLALAFHVRAFASNEDDVQEWLDDVIEQRKSFEQNQEK